jgi:hypothetical protein
MASASARRSSRRALPGSGAVRRFVDHRGIRPESVALAVLVALTIAVWAVTVFVTPSPLPVAAQTVPIVLGNLALGVRAQLRLLVVVLVAVGASLGELGVSSARVGSLGVVLVVAAIVLRTAYARDRLGLRGIPGDALLADLRDRLAGLSPQAELPDGWHIEVAQRLSGGITFGGDFLVTGRHGTRFEIALVDVSGKGLAAATRALQLSGALGGLIGAVSPSQFLAAANAYVLRQSWDDGFATAVHVTIDTDTGAYVVDSAGHPPAALFAGGTGQWSLSPAEGPALGLLANPDYPGDPGVIRRGDALLLYTDGVVEVSGQDLEWGIDRLLGVANRLVVDGFRGGGQRVLDAMPDAAGDDRAVVLMWRT